QQVSLSCVVDAQEAIRVWTTAYEGSPELLPTVHEVLLQLEEGQRQLPPGLLEDLRSVEGPGGIHSHLRAYQASQAAVAYWEAVGDRGADLQSLQEAYRAYQPPAEVVAAAEASEAKAEQLAPFRGIPPKTMGA